jgi:hypothetical protein
VPGGLCPDSGLFEPIQKNEAPPGPNAGSGLNNKNRVIFLHDLPPFCGCFVYPHCQSDKSRMSPGSFSKQAKKIQPKKGSVLPAHAQTYLSVILYHS